MCKGVNMVENIVKSVVHPTGLQPARTTDKDHFITTGGSVEGGMMVLLNNF